MLATVTLAIALSGPVVALDRAVPDVLIAQMDRLWVERAVPGRVPEMIALGEQILEIDPRSYDGSWRVARVYWFRGHRTADRQLAREAAAIGTRYARQAIELNPAGVEGHFVYALAVATYATTLSPVEAVVEGVAAKFETAALKAYALDRGFDHGAPIIALGRYYFELPWPVRDLSRSRRYLEEAQHLHPESLYGHVYLAETYHALGKEERAKRELRLVLAVAPTPNDPPDAQEPRDLARQAFERWFPEDARSVVFPAGEPPSEPWRHAAAPDASSAPDATR